MSSEMFRFGLPVVICIGAGLWLVGCSTPSTGKYDPEIKIAAETAQASFQRGEVSRAEMLYGKALARARLTDNREEIVRNAYNLGLCKLISGQLGDARHYLVQARMLACEKGLVTSRILLAESEVARLAGDGLDSAQLARQALSAGADREGQMQAWLLQGEASFRTGNLQSALDCQRRAAKQTSQKTPATLKARLLDLEANLVQVRVLSGSVAKLQISRAEWLKQAGQFNDMVKAFQAAALAFELESKWAEAFDCHFRVAQSLHAAGDIKQALAEAAKANELARQNGSEKQKTLATSLLDELK